MAEERRARRNQYFERAVANYVALNIVILKVEALLWMDRLIFHYWRTTARMAKLKNLKGEKHRFFIESALFPYN